MRNLLLTVGMVLTVVLLAANYPRVDFSKDSEKGIQFYRGSWNEALELAKKENKLIFLDVYASWCGPCKAMKNRTFSDEQVGNFYNQNFINVTVDGEKGEGFTLAEKFGVQAYPTLLFVDPNGKLVSGTAGYHNPNQLITLGRKVLQ